MSTTGVHIVAVDHPALGRDIERFLDELRGEQLLVGPSAADHEPFASSIEQLRGRGGFRMAAVECGRIVGLARVDGAGELALAVAADRRTSGIGTLLRAATLERAFALHYRRITISSSGGTARLGASPTPSGCVDELGRDRTDLVIDLTALARSA